MANSVQLQETFSKIVNKENKKNVKIYSSSVEILKGVILVETITVGKLSS